MSNQTELDLSGGDLRSLQSWMQTVVFDRRGVAEGADSLKESHGSPALAEMIHDLPTLSAPESIGIYARMIRLRLLEAVRTDFPAVRDVLGGPNFEAISQDFIERYPSQFKTLNAFSYRFPQFLKEHEQTAGRPFLAELAELELAIVWARGAGDAAALTEEELAAVQPEDWVEFPLQTVPALRLFAFEHPVENYYRGWLRDKEQELPESGSETSYVMVYRNNEGTWRSSLHLEQWLILKVCEQPNSLGQVLAEIGDYEGLNVERLQGELSNWFQEWAKEGLFRAQSAVDVQSD